MEKSVHTKFVPAHGLIIVKRGSVDEIQAALHEYEQLTAKVIPGTFRVEIHPQADGSFVLVAPDGLPTYDFANVTVWLDAPPGQPNTGNAVAWIDSPGDGEEYYFEPERENEWGDTIIGTSRNSRSVRVSVSDTAMSLAKHHVQYLPRPALALGDSPITVSITLDCNTDFGNPEFVPNVGSD